MAAFAALPAATHPAAAFVPRLGGALVLAGGGARGAYEAGVIAALATGVPDGQPIPGIDVVCGTSIGALNGWFVATAQYSRLAALWRGVGSETVFSVKRQFAAAIRPNAFILTKIVQALALAKGLTTNVQGILDAGTMERWFNSHIDPSVPVIVPLCFTVTNLDRSRAELMLRLPDTPTAEQRRIVVERLRATVGTEAPVRLTPDNLLDRAMRASATIPVLFDPVIMMSPEGSWDRYCDGGIADNDPIDVGRALALSVHSVLVDSIETGRADYKSALAIGVGAFGVAQARIIAASLRAAYLETRGKRLFESTAATTEERAFLKSILDADLSIIRPSVELSVQVVEFDRQEKIDAAYQQGFNDVARGWIRYAPPVG